MDAAGRKKILLVEDEAIIAMSGKMVLERNGYSVIIAGDGTKAIRLAEADSGIDLVLMDIDLGRGMDGTEAAKTILDTRDLPIVFLSSHTEPEVVEKTEGITSFGYIVKNSGETVLLASIRMAFRLFDSRQREMAKEAALMESEGRLLSILSAAPVGIGMVINRVLQSANARLCAMTGYGADELIGHSSAVLYPTQEEFEFVGREKYRQITETGTGTVETRWRCKDGSLIDVMLSSTPLDPANLDKGVTFTAMDISGRKRIEGQYQYHQALERMVIAMAVRFMESPLLVPSAGIQRSLRELGEFCGVDRSYIFIFDESLETMSNTHEWCALGIEPQMEKLQACPVNVAPWWIDTLLSAGEIVIPQVSEMPSVAAAERGVLESQGIRSLLAVGFRRNGCLSGYIGFDSVREERSWEPDVVALMHVVADLFAVALCRRIGAVERRAASITA
ncbi:MAG: response regulator [Spirochaetia bacterium]|jgi:PAS domain S-box-containing protein|nr:response regulator [Spirochaetia bacterium]